MANELQIAAIRKRMVKEMFLEENKDLFSHMN